MAQSAELSGIVLPVSIGSLTATLLTRSEFLQTLENDFNTTFISDFKEVAQFTFDYGTPKQKTVNIDVLFDEPHTSYNIQAPTEFNTLKPQIILQQTDLPDVLEHEMRVKVRGVLYFTEDYESNGVGVLTIYLRKH